MKKPRCFLRRGLPVTCLAVAAALLVSAAGADGAVSVDIDTGATNQTMRGWGCILPWFSPKSDRLGRQIVDVTVNDLGINAVRYEPPMGYLPRQQEKRWEWDNDDVDPLHVDWGAFDTGFIDWKLRTWLVPVQQAVEARGETLYVQVSPSFYDAGLSGEAFPWLLRSPGEYAEWATTILQRMRDEHGVTAATYTVCNEASYNNQFSEAITKQMAKAVGRRMRQLGFDTGIQFPESVNPRVASDWLTRSDADAELWEYIQVVSYHLYAQREYRSNVCAFARSKGVIAAQTEFLGNMPGDTFIYDDMMAGASSWEIYGMGFPLPDPNGTSFSYRPQYWLFRQFMPYIREGAVRVDAISGNGLIRPMAFIDDGNVTVVILNTTGAGTQDVNLSGLPAGEYGVCQSINEGIPTERGLESVGGDGLLTVNVPQNAVLTISPHNDGNQAPRVLIWQASDPYLKLGASSATVLSVGAMDTELDTLSYQWSVVEAPAGASVSLATPIAASCGASGLDTEGLYVFSVDVSDASHTVAREVMLKVFNGNQPPELMEIHIKNPIRPILPTSSATLGCEATDLEGDPITYLWSVVSQPGGASATLAAPTATPCGVSGMTVAGDYVFRIEAGDGTDTVSEDLTVTVEPEDVHAPVISNLTVALLPDGTGGNLSAETSDADGGWMSHWWEATSQPAGSRLLFSNQGGPATTVHADTAGTYKFRLNVVGRNRYTASTEQTLALPAADIPVAGFVPSRTQGSIPLTVSFHDNSVGTITNRFWDFGDGATTNTTATTVEHIYNTTGTMTVELIATGPSGAGTNTQVDVIRVTLPGVPSASFTASPTSGWIPLGVAFTDTSTGSITNRFWDFGDGATTNTMATSLTHTYAAAGAYTVRLVAMGPAGSSTNTQVDAITATAPVAPNASFTASPISGFTPLEVVFTDTSTGSITNRFWDFGDGDTTSTSATEVSHTYTHAGLKTVRLTVSGPVGTSTNTRPDLICVRQATTTTNAADADQADQYATESTPLSYNWVGQGSARVGDTPTGMRYTYVIPFPLPALPAGETISEVVLKVYAESKTSFSSATDVYIDIRGGRVDVSPTVTDVDVTGTTEMLLDNAQIVNQTVVTPIRSAFALDSAFFQAIYDSDPAAVGKFVFITMRVDKIDPMGSNSYLTYTSANGAENQPMLSIVTGGSAASDADGDGLPDDWETAYFGGPTNAHASAMASNGVNTVYETYVAGLNPTNPQSFFVISDLSVDPYAILQWDSVCGRVYGVYGSSNLLHQFQPVATNVHWPGNSWTSHVVNHAPTFYRLGVTLEP